MFRLSDLVAQPVRSDAARNRQAIDKILAAAGPALFPSALCSPRSAQPALRGI